MIERIILKVKNFTKKRFYDFDNPFSVFKNIRDGTLTLEKAKQFKLDFNEIKKKEGTTERREKVRYIIMKHFTKQETVLSIPKQILQRLTIAFAQVKTGKTSENLLNKIHQLIFYFYRVTEITIKVHNKY